MDEIATGVTPLPAITAVGNAHQVQLSPEEGTFKADTIWQVKGFEDAMTSDLQRPPWVVEGLLLKDTATLLSAQPHCMKSLSLLDASLGAVSTKKVWGHFDAPGVESVLFIETEDPAWMVESRIRGLAKGLNVDGKASIPGFHYVCPGPFDLLKEEETFRELFNKYRPNFTVLSTLQNLLAGRSWLKQDDMQPIMAALVRLSRECPLFVITHSPWDKKAKRAAGTITQTANFVTTLHFEKARKKEDTFVHVTVDSKAGGSDSDFSLQLLTSGDKNDPGAVRSVRYTGEGWPKGLARDAVLRELESDPHATSQDIAERAGVTARYVQSLRKELAKSPQAERVQ